MISYHTKVPSPLSCLKSKSFPGGQTSVDRAALDAALASDIECGGWCPNGRKAEDGKIPPHYPVTELKKSGYTKRT